MLQYKSTVAGAKGRGGSVYETSISYSQAHGLKDEETNKTRGDGQTEILGDDEYSDMLERKQKTRHKTVSGEMASQREQQEKNDRLFSAPMPKDGSNQNGKLTLPVLPNLSTPSSRGGHLSSQTDDKIVYKAGVSNKIRRFSPPTLLARWLDASLPRSQLLGALFCERYGYSSALPTILVGYLFLSKLPSKVCIYLLCLAIIADRTQGSFNRR
jgi:hypothetical protein